MGLDELEQKLTPFCLAHYETNSLSVHDVFKMPGHAGFAYGFSVKTINTLDKWYVRFPPPNVKFEGTADVLRQVAALNAMPEYVPHCRVK